MIQDIFPKVFHNEFIDDPLIDHPLMLKARVDDLQEDGAAPSGRDVVLAFNGRHMLMKQEEDGRIVTPAASLFSEEDRRELRYLFSIDESRYFLYRGDTARFVPEQDELFPGFRFEKLLKLRTGYPQELCFAGETGYHLYVWYRDNSFCGRCGKRMRHSTKERAMQCPDCGNIVYPRINPAVIIGLTDGDRIIMTKYAGRETKGNALIAGFCEIGETAEETVAREVMEEVGLEVENIRYYKSQPWGFELDLLMGFYCNVKGSRDITMDEQELASARWIHRDDIASDPNGISLTSEMIHYFKTHPEAFS